MAKPAYVIHISILFPLEKGFTHMNLNKIQLIGNLAADPITRELPSGQTVSTFRLLTNTSSVEVEDAQYHDRTEFHQIVSYGRLANVVAKYLKKGDRIYLDGSLTHRTWNGTGDKQRSRTEVVMQNLIMMGSGKKSSRKTNTKEKEQGED